MNKTMAFFWGGQPLSYLRYLTIYSFRKFHPNWRIKLYLTRNSAKEATWTSGEKQDFMRGEFQEDYYLRLAELDVEEEQWRPGFDVSKYSPVHQSDLFQWWWLSRNTGFYSDMDVLYLDSIDDLAEEMREHTLAVCVFDGIFPIGFLGSQTQGQFYQDVMHVALHRCEVAKSNAYQNAGCDAVYATIRYSGWPHKTDKLKKTLQDAYKSEKFMFISGETIYPWKWKETSEIFEQDLALPKTCKAIHWYAGASLSQAVNTGITEKNFRDYTPCTFTTLACERVLT